MPMLYALGQHQALRPVLNRFYPYERVLAFDGDVYAVAQPERIVAHRILGEELWQHSRIPARPKSGTGVAMSPVGTKFGRSDRHPEERGIRVLGTPFGTPEFVRSQLDATEAAHQLLFQQIPAVQDLQSLLSFFFRFITGDILFTGMSS